MMITPRLTTVLGLALTGVMSLSACAGNADSLTLSPAAEQGRQISNARGCGACHGTSGQGGIGPPFAGLFGSTVELDDGSTVVADRQYLIESIKQPDAKKVDGYVLAMPTNRLTDDEIDLVITYIEALASLAAPARGAAP
jgi:mono/diheme cytochrome c family protein